VDGGVPRRLLSAELALLLLTGALGMTPVNFALPVLPLTVTETTHLPAAAGVVTAVAAACTIVLELLSANLLRRFHHRTLLAAALLVQVLAMAGFAGLRELPAMLVCGALAGAGFGLSATVTASAVASLAPPDRQGEAAGYFGLSASAPAVIAPPVALLLLNASGPGAVFVAGAATCAAGALIATRLTASARRASAFEPGNGVLATLSSRGVLRIWLAFVCAAVTYGAAVSFTPLLLGTEGPGSALVFLLVFGLTRAVTRALSGRLIDRGGDRRFVLPGLAAGGLALALLPFHVPLLTVLSAVVYGAAFGVVQTGTFVGLLRAAGPARAANVSGIWNMAVDVGFGSGALVLAPVAAGLGFTRMFWLLPVLFAVAFMLRVPGRPTGSPA
jgi:predicted MFS family arabinose efflux permease